MDFYKEILSKLKENQNIYLLTVVENIGSSPGRQGFKMFVSQDGFIFGSIGGGIMEYQFVEKVKKDLKTDKLEVLFKRQIHQGKAKKDRSGMICSGEQTVVFHPITQQHIPLIEQIIAHLSKNIKVVLELNSDGIFLTNNSQDEQFYFRKKEKWSFKELLSYKEIFYIIGAGHVGLALSKILDYLGFYVVIFDNRKNLNTLEQNSFVKEKYIIDYKKINTYIKPNHFVAIMTSKFIDDKQILKSIIHKKHKYLGVLGSKKKIQIMFKSMINEGFTSMQLDQIFAPIGFSIKSQSPEEIAVSIAAQVIQKKNISL